MADLQEALERLRLVESASAPVLSVYLELAPELTEKRSIGARIRDLLDPIDTLAASGDLDRRSSKSLRCGVQRAIGLAPDLTTELGRGVALFICDELGLDEQLTMPRRIWDCAVAGPQPYLRPLQAAIDSYRRVAAVVIDGRGAEIVVSHMAEVVDRRAIEAEELRKSDVAGWHGLEEYRHRQHAEEVRNRMFREVAARLDRLRRDIGVDLVLIGGQVEVTQALLPFLDERVREMAETFVTDLHTLTPAVLAATVSDLEQAHRQREEVRHVDETYATAAAGGLATIGVDGVLKAVHHRAVALLLIDHGAWRGGMVCSDCGALAIPAPACPQCGGETETVPDLLEALSRSVVDAGGAVEHVDGSTQLTDDLVAARLRFVSWV
ncbi:MAG: hypothetical protein M3349_09130 [Actinomycetota bacterium]|nr:hypothetical protein [Actinomycetota bacterium]